jgi:hypothetical protein
MIARRATQGSLFAALALAAVGFACPGGNGPKPDAAGGSGGTGGGGRGGTGGGGGSADATGGSGGRDSASPRDTGPDLAPDRPDGPRPDAPADLSPDAGVNPKQLWFSGPDGDFHLNDFEPQDAF